MTIAALKLETRALCKSYPTRQSSIEVLRDLSIGIRPGELVSIVGASGCGKTSFLRLVDGLIAPSSGEILVDGKAVHDTGPERAFVFQQDGPFPWRTIIQNVCLGPEIQKKDRQVARERGKQLLRLVGLAGFEDQYPHELSGGMRQRVNLTRALAVEPDILLMDEPFAALDAQTREIMQSELLNIWAQTGKTVLFVTHGIDEAVYLSDRVLIFTVRPGRLKEEVVIDLPRPRQLSIKHTPKFAEYTDHIWNAIEHEVRESIAIEKKLHGGASE